MRGKDWLGIVGAIVLGAMTTFLLAWGCATYDAATRKQISFKTAGLSLHGSIPGTLMWGEGARIGYRLVLVRVLPTPAAPTPQVLVDPKIVDRKKLKSDLDRITRTGSMR